MNKINWFSVFILFLLPICNVHAAENIEAYELVYEEREAGTDPYQVKFTVTERYLRIDQLDDDSGYIVFDNHQNIVNSISHPDLSVLVIPQYKYKKPDLTKQLNIEYLSMPDAPKISGKTIYTYRVTSSEPPADKCMDIKLAERLLPEVTNVLMAYQKMLAGQQSRLLEVTPEEFRSACFLADQVYNEGGYYRKGLPIQEWHSNGKTRLLVSYKKVKVAPEIFKTEDSYQKYSLD